MMWPAIPITSRYNIWYRQIFISSFKVTSVCMFIRAVKSKRIILHLYLCICFLLKSHSVLFRDLQSYLSHLSLFLAPQSNKFYVLVDNRPWLKDLYPRSAHLWQLMVTKVASKFYSVTDPFYFSNGKLINFLNLRASTVQVIPIRKY